jgi:FkbH-like protein
MTPEPVTAPPGQASKPGQVKCVVWDLDGTIWDGILLEDPEVAVRDRIVDVIRELDELGVLHSISSKNDYDLAMDRLRQAGLDEYFLYPQIGWGPKSESIRRIAASLNIGIDALAFVDDQPVELAEVRYAHPGVRCVPADDIIEEVRRPEFRPRFVTSESRERRRMYAAGAQRDSAEQDFAGTPDEFLATLRMRMRISEAGEEDLQRAEELTVRTNQLNSTGRTLSYEQLDELRASPRHLLLVAALDDTFGSYGKIGLAVVETARPSWRLCLLLMSCRVVSRGVGTVLLNHIMRLARDDGAQLIAEFLPTGRNRMMFVTYMFAGFREVGREGEVVLLGAPLDRIQPVPPYLTLEVG